MKTYRSLLLTLLLQPIAAHATNPCDVNSKYCSDNLTDSANQASSDARKSGTTLKAAQEYRVKSDAVEASATQLLKVAEGCDAKAHDLDIWTLDSQAVKRLDKLKEPLNAQDRTQALAELMSLMSVRNDLHGYEYDLVARRGSLETIIGLLPRARLRADKLQQIDDSLAYSDSIISTACKGVKDAETAVKSFAALP